MSVNVSKICRVLSFSLFVGFQAGCSRVEIPVEMPDLDINVNARTAIIVDAETGRVLYGKDPSHRYPPASTVKIMTAILAIENSGLDAEVTPTAAALNVQPTIVGLRAGVTYTMEDLLSAILIRSGNDAARAIAEKVAGNEEAFAMMMNEKAREIGMDDTYFLTASGLPAGRPDPQYTTAEDLAKLMRYASRYEFILSTMSRKGDEISGSDGRTISLRTNNRALNQWEDAPWGKTGYTREARRTFAGTDPSTEPKIVLALLQSGDLWNDIKELNDKGLELYEFSRKTIVLERSIITEIVDWVTTRREIGRKRSLPAAAPN